MERNQSAETHGFAAIAAGFGSAARLPAALPGLHHRHAGHLALASISGRAVELFEHRGELSGARPALSEAAFQASRGLLAVGGGPGGSRRPSPVARGRVVDQAVAVCLTGVVHNGAALRQALVERGALLGEGSQAELLLHLMAQSRQRTLVNRLVEALERMVGGFSMALISDELAVAARDPRGFRPLWLASVPDGHAVASDPAALRGLGAVELREVAAGEVVLLEPGAPARSLRPWGVFPRASCAMEWLLWSRLSASFDGQSVHAVRHRLGRALGASSVASADLVTSLPGACPTAALAFARQAELPYECTFDPAEADRFAPDEAVIEAAVRGRRVILVISAGQPAELLRGAIRALGNAGARQVHLRSITPLQRSECPYGMDLPTPLVSDGASLDPQALLSWLRADSFDAGNLEGLATALGREPTVSCCTCLGGTAPLQARDAAATPQLPLFEG
jgi:amidophosphoribosyltransferase